MSANEVVWFFNRIGWAMLPQLFDTYVKQNMLLYSYTQEKMTHCTTRVKIYKTSSDSRKKYDVRSRAPLSAAVTENVVMLWSDASKG